MCPGNTSQTHIFTQIFVSGSAFGGTQNNIKVFSKFLSSSCYLSNFVFQTSSFKTVSQHFPDDGSLCLSETRCFLPMEQGGGNRWDQGGQSCLWGSPSGPADLSLPVRFPSWASELPLRPGAAHQCQHPLLSGLGVLLAAKPTPRSSVVLILYEPFADPWPPWPQDTEAHGAERGLLRYWSQSLACAHGGTSSTNVYLSRKWPRTRPAAHTRQCSKGWRVSRAGLVQQVPAPVPQRGCARGLDPPPHSVVRGLWQGSVGGAGHWPGQLLQ